MENKVEIQKSICWFNYSLKKTDGPEADCYVLLFLKVW